MLWVGSSPRFLVAQRRNGPTFSLKLGKSTNRQRWSCFPEQPGRVAGLRNRLWVRSIAPLIRKFTSTRVFFFQDLERRFRACDIGSKTCQFSQAYVIAHEIGHHVQNLLGLLPEVQQAQRGMGKAEANSLQVRVELQADCFAGIWANRAHAKWQFIEPGDVEAALQTASAIGDDRLQKQSQGYVVPDAFTHGSSAQRTRWFMTGLKSGSVPSCDTFRTEQL
jgi:predicted metalloprotease